MKIAIYILFILISLTSNSQNIKLVNSESSSCEEEKHIEKEILSRK